jgi:hypothetical protein
MCERVRGLGHIHARGVGLPRRSKACPPAGASPAVCSLGVLAALYQGLSANAVGATEWLVGVALGWASTCHVDVPQVGR